MRSLQLQATAHFTEVLHTLPPEESKLLETIALKLVETSPVAEVPVHPPDTLPGMLPPAIIDVEPEQE